MAADRKMIWPFSNYAVALSLALMQFTFLKSLQKGVQMKINSPFVRSLSLGEMLFHPGQNQGGFVSILDCQAAYKIRT